MRKKLIEYTINILLLVYVFCGGLFDDISGKYALFNKAYKILPFMLIGIIALIALVSSIKRILSKKIQIALSDKLYILFLLIVAVIFLSFNIKTTIAICKDTIEGKYSTTLAISDDSKSIHSGLWHTKYYLKGTVSEGEFTTFEISDIDFTYIIYLNKAKLIKINYWKNSKTLCDWVDISN